MLSERIDRSEENKREERQMKERKIKNKKKYVAVSDLVYFLSIEFESILLLYCIHLSSVRMSTIHIGSM